jgi:WD40 repeat protein
MVQNNPLAKLPPQSPDEIKRIVCKGFAPHAVWFLPPDGRKALSLNSDSSLRVWDLDAGRELQLYSNPDPNRSVRSAALTADARHMFLGWSNNTAQLVDLQTGKPVKMIEHPGPIETVAMTPDGKFGLVAGGSATTTDGVTTIKDAAARVWDLQEGKEIAILDRPNELVRRAALAPDGSRAVTNGAPDTLHLWALPGSQLTHQLRVENVGALNRLAHSPDGRYIVGSWSNVAIVVTAAELKLVRQIVGHDGMIFALAMSADSKYLLTGAGSFRDEDAESSSADATVRLWDVGTGQELKQFTGHGGRVVSVAFSPDGRRAISASLDKTIRIWNLGIQGGANPQPGR